MARPGIPQPDRSRTEALGVGCEQAVCVTAIATAGNQQRSVLGERDGIYLLKTTGRLPLDPTRGEVGRFHRLIVAAADDRGTVLRQSNGRNREIVPRQGATGGFRADPVKSYVLANPTDDRLAVGCESQRQHPSRQVDSPLKLGVSGIPD